MRVAKTIELDERSERELRVLAKRRRVEARLQQRALVVLLAAKGWQNKDIAVEAGLDRRQVALPGRWHRCASQGRAALGSACNGYGRGGVADRARHTA